MSDGPNIEKLFNEMQCLNAQSNAREIVRWLRFYRDETAYQQYLKHYLPMFAKPEYEAILNEFVDDLSDKELAKELKTSLKPKPAAKADAPAKSKEAVVVKAEKEIEKKSK